ncbi:MAG: type IV secretory system conjugative DNA transfer family protein, partial [Pseudomonadota bacterium]|nr:type IV secretory system conjugative DNA transfer family protein [Pseudomonadota bacterium]
VVQTASQFDEVYGPHGRKIIQKALTARIVFAPNNMEDARNICAELGDTTVKVRSRNVPGFGGGRNRSPSTTISEQRRALMLPQELKAMQRTEQLFLLDYLQTVKCKRIEYYTDPVFKARVLPPPIVRSHDVTRFTGVRAEDRFAMWQDKILKAQRASAPAGTVSVPRAMPVVPPVQTKTGLSQRSEVAPASRFSLDFSQVEIPAGRYLSPSEIPAAVEAFMDDLEASEASLADAAA